ncbi:hypothetical protein C0989_001409 [Termitomyces sp. Mn162]|nr:hypothetical protein C0989_001409 [Termitomyces sp. Mn162]
MSENLLVVIDSNSDKLVYEGGSNGRWTTKSGTQWYGNSSAWSGTASGSIHITFTGNTVAFYGHSPPLEQSQEMTVTIDEQKSYKTDFPADNAGSYCQWWQSPRLDDGTHTILLEGLTRTSLDFVVVTVNDTSVRKGQQVIVDDDDASIIYHGDWSRNIGPFTSHGGELVSFPFHNATHQSTTVGSSVSFNFTGSSIAVYGSLSAGVPGSITARYTLDSNVTTSKYDRPENPPQANAVLALRNFLFYSNGSLDAGDHTLLIEIEDVQSLTYDLDYIVYTYSDKMVSYPADLTPPASHTNPLSSVTLTSSTSSKMITTAVSSSSSSSSSTSSSSSSVDITPTITLSTTSLVPTSPPTSNSESTTSSNATPTAVSGSINTNLRTGEIIGIAAGSTVILAVLIAAILYYQRRRNRLRRFALLHDIGSSSSFGTLRGKSEGSRSLTPIEPFTLSHPAPGSRAVESPDLKNYNVSSFNRNFDFNRFSALHRRSGSGPRLSEDSAHYTLATSSSTIAVDRRPPSYKF